MDISRQRCGSSIHEDFNMQKISAKWFRNAWTRIKIIGASSLSNFEIFRCDANYFLTRLVTMIENLLHLFDTETNQQWMEWRHIGSSRSKFKSECTNSVENSSPRFSGIKTAFSSLIIFQRDKLSTRSFTNCFWCHYKTFEGKTPCKFSKGVLFLHDNSPAHRALATQKELAYLGFHCLDHTP